MNFEPNHFESWISVSCNKLSMVALLIGIRIYYICEKLYQCWATDAWKIYSYAEEYINIHLFSPIQYMSVYVQGDRPGDSNLLRHTIEYT